MERLGEVGESQKFVKAAYQMNQEYIASRGAAVASIGSLTALGTIVFIVVIFLVKILISQKMAKYLRNRKLI